jgi:hypothetical protein
MNHQKNTIDNYLNELGNRWNDPTARRTLKLIKDGNYHYYIIFEKNIERKNSFFKNILTKIIKLY